MATRVEFNEARAALALYDAATACRDLAGPHLAPSADAGMWRALARHLNEKAIALLTPARRSAADVPCVFCGAAPGAPIFHDGDDNKVVTTGEHPPCCRAIASLRDAYGMLQASHDGIAEALAGVSEFDDHAGYWWHGAVRAIAALRDDKGTA